MFQFRGKRCEIYSQNQSQTLHLCLLHTCYVLLSLTSSLSPPDNPPTPQTPPPHETPLAPQSRCWRKTESNQTI